MGASIKFTERADLTPVVLHIHNLDGDDYEEINVMIAPEDLESLRDKGITKDIQIMDEDDELSKVFECIQVGELDIMDDDMDENDGV